jgi:hypothetical protein
VSRFPEPKYLPAQSISNESTVSETIPQSVTSSFSRRSCSLENNVSRSQPKLSPPAISVEEEYQGDIDLESHPAPAHMSEKKHGKMPVRKAANPFATTSTPETCMINRSDSFFEAVEKHIEDIPKSKKGIMYSLNLKNHCSSIIENITLDDPTTPKKQKDASKRKAQSTLSAFRRKPQVS